MELTWTALLFLCVAALAAWFWHSSLAAREQANFAAQQACERMQLQFLDGTVAFSSLTLTRGGDGWLTLRRTYIFDYTADSVERLQGFVILQGARIESVGFASDETARARSLARRELAAPHAAQVTPPEPPLPTNVLDLEEWRKRHRSDDDPSVKGGQGGHGGHNS
jgi:hypothetical protein